MLLQLIKCLTILYFLMGDIAESKQVTEDDKQLVQILLETYLNNKAKVFVFILNLNI